MSQETVITPISGIQRQLINDTAVFALVADRVYPTRVETTGLVLPAVSFSILGGSLSDNPYRETELQFAYVSEVGIDQALEIYGAVNAVLHQNQWTANSVNYRVIEASAPVDATDDYMGRWLYVISNTYEIKTVG